MPDLPFTYFVSCVLAALLLVFGVFNLRTAWGIPYIVVVLTISAWYFIEPLYSPREFFLFNSLSITAAYDAVLVTLVTYGVSAPAIARWARPRRSGRTLSSAHVSAEKVLAYVVALWLLLLTYGTLRLQGNLFGALFPIGGRAHGDMWARSAGYAAGNSGFIVSAASYLYVLCLASFGVLFTLLSRKGYVTLAIILIMISWPYIVLQGSRNLVLAVALPALGSYLLYSRHGSLRKGVVLAGTIFALEFAFRAIFSFRNIGFENVDLVQVEAAKHLGFNMASELIYCIKYTTEGVLQISYGQNYFAELANIIPRSVWPGKPLIGIDYAVVRGFRGQHFDIGVFATISSGMVGGGVLNFGSIIGPIFVGLFMSCWTGLLSRFRSQATPLRMTLFLIGLGVTFNLGRDITLLVLWPVLFGYMCVRAIEWRASVAQPRRRALRTQLRT